MVSAITVWIIHLQASAAQVPLVTYVAPKAIAPGTGEGADAAGAAGSGSVGQSAAASSSPLDRVDRAKWGADGNGDGVASPAQIDDAALAAARYLCASGTMTNAAGWRAAVFPYNQSNAYVNEVAAIANRYAADVSGLS
jgi:hypothetical protein